MLIQNPETNEWSAFQITLEVVDLDVITELEKHEQGHAREPHSQIALLRSHSFLHDQPGIRKYFWN